MAAEIGFKLLAVVALATLATASYFAAVIISPWTLILTIPAFIGLVLTCPAAPWNA